MYNNLLINAITDKNYNSLQEDAKVNGEKIRQILQWISDKNVRIILHDNHRSRGEGAEETKKQCKSNEPKATFWICICNFCFKFLNKKLSEKYKRKNTVSASTRQHDDAFRARQHLVLPFESSVAIRLL